MYRYLFFIYFATQICLSVEYIISQEVSDDKELVLAFATNRHGERSPDSDELSLADDKETLKNLTYLEGLEGLTLSGKRRGYQLGKFIRERYGAQGHKILSNLYLPQEISIRTTDKERTKMTALVAMAATYPPEPAQQWDDALGKYWQPVPYSSVSLDRDYLRFYSNCRKYKTLMAEAKQQALNEEFKPFLDLIPIIYNHTGQNFTTNLLSFQTLFDLFKSQSSLGLKIPFWAEPLLPRLEEAARLAYKLYFRSEEMKKIGGGVVLSNFLKTASDYVTGKTKQKKLYMFSAHDFNVGSLMEVTNVLEKPHSIPEYGSLFALELYRSRSRGDYSVLPVYLSKAGESLAEVFHFSDCQADTYCDLNQFKEFTKKYVLPEEDFNSMCYGNSMVDV